MDIPFLFSFQFLRCLTDLEARDLTKLPSNILGIPLEVLKNEGKLLNSDSFSKCSRKLITSSLTLPWPFQASLKQRNRRNKVYFIG